MANTTDPSVAYETYVQALVNDSGNPQAQALGFQAASSLPAYAQQQMAFAQAEQQLGDTGPALQQQADTAGLMAGYQLGNLGINAQQQALQQQGTQQSYGLQQQGFQQQAQQNQFNYQNQLQQMTGNAAASGVLSTSASKLQQSNLGQQAQFANQTLNRQEQQAAGDYARAQQGYQLAAQANGISQQEVYTRLQSGLQQLGVNMSPDQVMSSASQALTGESTGMAGVLANAGLLEGSNFTSAFGG